MATPRDKWVRRFVITETSCHKRGFTIYKVTSIVFMKASPERASKVSVWKRYNDFKKLHKSLNNIYKTLNMKETFPPFPKANYFSRFETDVIKERRDSAVKLLEFIGRHQALFTSNVFVKFFEVSLQADGSGDCNQSVESDTSEDSQVGSTGHYALPDDSLITQKKFENFQQFSGTFVKFPLHNSDESPRNTSESQKIIEPDSPKIEEDYGQYVLVAAAHISAGYRHESMNEHDEAFIQYKLGITNLSHGVKIDPDPVRQVNIYKKIEKYSERAEALYNRYLKNNILLLSKPIEELKNYKVIKVMNSVMLVRDLRTNVKRVIKTIEKPSSGNVNIHNYITRGNAPFMVKLYGWVQTETTVFIILQYVKAQELWGVIKKRYGLRDKSVRKKNSLRSASCDATLQSKDINFSKIEITDSESADNEDLPTRKLLEKAQILLKSVDATIRKSNSIADRLNKPKFISSVNETDKIRDDSDGNQENSEDSGIEMDNELWKIPESIVKQWTAQIIVTLEFLHRQGIIMKNLIPENLLLGDNDKIVMCYVTPKEGEFNMQYKIPYAAPELCNFVISETKASESSVIWSFGVILYELLTGMKFQARHAAGSLCPHSIISIPSDLSDNAKSLLSSILIFEATERPTIEQIKQHPFYQQIEWEVLVNS